MNIYTKFIDEQKIVRLQNEIVIIKDDRQIINPSHDMLIEDGWEIYVVNNEQKITETFESVKKDLIKDINAYDSSEDINSFYIQDKQIWLDKSTRVGLSLRFNSELQNGYTETTLWYNGESFTLPIETAMKILYDIELYASKCYDNTQKHLSNVNKLETIEELKSYDYTIGYPVRLTF